MDWENWEKQWLNLGQCVKELGEKLYPQWQWELWPKDSSKWQWMRDVCAIKARLPEVNAQGILYRKRGIVIDIGEWFLSEYLQMPQDDSIQILETVIHGAIVNAEVVPEAMQYPCYIATMEGGEKFP